MSRSGGRRPWRRARLVVVAALCWLGGSGVADAQLGALISPGRLSRPHADLEGITKCSSCHERGQRVTAGKCLACHQPVAERIAKGVGVHASVKDDCVACHVEHAGVNGELRPFDWRRFDHARVTGFPLDGKHANLTAGCTACHKVRSFLTLSPTCASCHADVHKGSLGKNCTSCHTTKTNFKDLGGNFDHSRSAFPLRGAHRTASCASCHVDQTFKGLSFSSCASCHKDPHQGSMGATCTSCHTETSWRTPSFNHSRTGFVLKGLHASVRCEGCHTKPATRVKLKSDTCASCHADPHRGTFPQDCSACHTEKGFKGAPFDHTTTAFALSGAHAALDCDRCHKPGAATAPSRSRSRSRAAVRPVADFRGLKTACASCHADVHQGELGAKCETCHSDDTFHLASYRHARQPEFFGGAHAAVACAKCHVAPPAPRPARTGGARVLAVKFTATSTACATCHRDVHLGQEGSDCQTCHTVRTAGFKIERFAHDRTGFRLTGRHLTIECALCHKVETGRFPAGQGTATRLKGIARECRACHQDVHLGQLDRKCDTCHATDSFHLSRYRHRRRDDFFVGSHTRAECRACHKSVRASFPAGRGVAIQFQMDRQCVACHEDTHRGALGPRCGDCHRP